VNQTAVSAKKTPLYAEHVRSGAKMVEFAGFTMPIFYGGIVGEHRRVRESVGLFDVSHMGEFVISGPDALPAIDRILTNKVASLFDGRVQYTGMCYEDGGFVDDLLVYRLPGRFMLVVNASNKDKDFEWIRANLRGRVTLDDVSDETALVAIQGPSSEAVLAKTTDTDLSELPYYHSAEVRVAGVPLLVSRTGYTGEDGFEIYCRPHEAVAVWNALMEAGSSEGIEPVGLGARDTLRLEMGYPLYGNEMDETRTPVEAGLMWVTKLDKGDFIGRKAIQKRLDEGAPERLIAFELAERGIPRHGQRIVIAGRPLGAVTSGTFSPSLEKGVGMGYVPADASGAIEIEIRDKTVAAKPVSLPFYKRGTVRRRKAQTGA
jgi:aminomethyltransferase